MRLFFLFFFLLLTASAPCAAQTPYLLSPDSQAQPGVPQGKSFEFDYAATPQFYPGSRSHITVYVPAQYDGVKPACLCVGLDGPNFRPQIVFDNLIAKKQMPVTIGVFVSPGTVNKPGTNDPVRFDRCLEFDSVNDKFARFLTGEILPAVEARKTPDGQAIWLSTDPNDRMIYGGSSGGVCAFTAAWLRPDLFRRVFTAIGTYVGMRGADQYPTLVRKTEPKPIRIFLQDGAQDTWNPLFDNWYTQNRSMEESLRFAGYDVNHNWGTLGHEGSHAESLFPEVVKWLWRDYPAPITAGHSGNSMLGSVLAPGEDWHLEDGPLAPNSGGTGQRPGKALPLRLSSPSGSPNLGRGGLPSYSGSPELGRGGFLGLPYAAEGNKLWHLSAKGAKTKGAKTKGAKTLADTLPQPITGLVLSPDHALLFAAQGDTHWIYTYVVQPGGSLGDRQRFYWLHAAESADDSANDGSGATDLAVDANGNLYAATRMGVQICDRNGRVEGILTRPEGPATSLYFGGSRFDTLYAVFGGHLYARHLNAHGLPPGAPPIPLPPYGGG